MVVVHHCCQLGLGGKHITAPFYLCRHLGLFAITEYDMTALQSALKFYWLLRQVPQLRRVLQAGVWWGAQGLWLPARRCCRGVAWAGAILLLLWEGSQGKNLWGASLQVCVPGPPRLAGGWLPGAYWSALSPWCIALPGGWGQESQGKPRSLPDLGRILLHLFVWGQTKGGKRGSLAWQNPSPSMQQAWAW